ncbi:MAG: DUF4153 domain-containing protein [Eubacterium sp.]
MTDNGTDNGFNNLPPQGNYAPQSNYAPQGRYAPQGDYSPQGRYAPQGNYGGVPYTGYSQYENHKVQPPLTEEERRRNTVCFIAAIVSYFIGYIYVNRFWGFGVFGILFAVYVEAFAYAMKVRRGKESSFWLAMLLAQCVAIMLWDYADPVLSELQLLMLHLTAVYYVMSRSGVLVNGETSAFVPFDLLAGFGAIPFSNLLSRLNALIHFRPGKNKAGQWIFGILLAAVFGFAAWYQLAGASDFFYEQSRLFSERFGRFFDSVRVAEVILSIPVGMWLFGLICGSLKAERSPFASLPAKAKTWHRAEPAVFTVSMTVLVAIYALFFVTSSRDFLTSVSDTDNFSAVDASGFAVKGFWNLIRIVLLNETLLAMCAVFGKEGERPKSLTAATYAISAMSFAFAALDAVKLGIYIGMFGWTLRRFYAIWAIGYITMTVAATVVRMHRDFNIVKVLALSGAAIFSALCLMNAQGWPLFD